MDEFRACVICDSDEIQQRQDIDAIGGFRLAFAIVNTVKCRGVHNDLWANFHQAVASALVFRHIEVISCESNDLTAGEGLDKVGPELTVGSKYHDSLRHAGDCNVSFSA